MPSKRTVADDPSATSAAAEAAAGPSTSAIGDYDLPKTTVTKIAKGAFDDPTVKFQQDVFLALQKSATVYINYIASAAQEYAIAANRKTLNPQDVLQATTEHLSGIGGDLNAGNELRQFLEDELQAFRINQATLKAAKAQAGPTSGPKRGFPGKGKTAGSSVVDSAREAEDGDSGVRERDGEVDALDVGLGDGGDEEEEDGGDDDDEDGGDDDDEEHEEEDDQEAELLPANDEENGVVQPGDAPRAEDNDTEMR